MSTQTIDPIRREWTTRSNSVQLAHAIVEQLAPFEVAEIPRDLVPAMAAAAAELTEELGLGWRVSADETPVMLIRIIARAALVDPTAGGQYCIAVLDRLIDFSPR